jgi:hypothetical protein
VEGGSVLPMGGMGMGMGQSSSNECWPLV